MPETGVRRDRPPPLRSAELWGAEFARALGDKSISAATIERIAARDDRLRERRPTSVVTLVRANATLLGRPVSVLVRMANRFSGFLALQPETVAARVEEVRCILRVGRTEATAAIEQTPLLLCLAEGALTVRAAALRKLLGLSGERWCRILQRQSQLLARRPESIASLVTGLRRELVLDTADFAALIEREPALLSRSPASISQMVDDLTQLLGFDPEEARAWLLRAPKLMRSGPVAVWQRNLRYLASGLEVEFERVLRAALAFPPLVYLDAERIVAGIASSADRIGISATDLAAILLRSPTLLGRRSADWPRRMRLLRRIAAMTGEPVETNELLTRIPAALTYRIDRLLQRGIMARFGIGTKSWTNLLTMADVKARKLLNDHFRGHPEHKALARALRGRSLL